MKIVLLIVILLILILLATGYAFFFIGIVRYPAWMDKKNGLKFGEFEGTVNEGKEWFRAQNPERIEISSHDGLRLVGLHLPAENPRGLILLFHGYRMDGYTDFSCVYRLYHHMGYSIINVFQRAHGESEGKYITFGIKERYDCQAWAMYAADRFGPDMDIFMDGLSMGASSVLMASALELPKSVRGIIADSGFTSPREQFIHILKSKFHLPPHPILDIAEGFSQLIAGFSFSDYSTLKAMEKNTLPILFIHGEEDTLVPMNHSISAYAACNADKKLITVPEAPHGFGYLVDPERCQQELRHFLVKHGSK